MPTFLPRPAWAALLGAAVLTACDAITEPEEQRLVDVQLDFCSNDTPIWFAYRNQDADWIRVTPDGAGTVAFTATNRVILAFTRITGASARTEIVYAHNLELEQVSGRACLEEIGGKQVNGSVAGVNSGQLAEVTMNFASVFLQSNQSLWSLSQLPDRPVDLIASRMNVDGASYAANRVIIRRSINPVNNATLPVLDFSVVGTESFTPASATVQVTGASGATAGYVISNFTSQLETSHELAFLDGPPASSLTVTAIPEVQMASGDYHTVIAAVFEPDGSARGAQRFFTTPAAQTVAIAGPTDAPTVSTIATTPYARLRAAAPRHPAYGGAFTIEYTQAQGPASENAVVVTVTRLYASGAEWRADIPDLSSVTGWQNSWGLQAGGSEVDWTSFVFGGRAEVILGAAPANGEGLPFATHSSEPVLEPAMRAVSAPRPPLSGRAR